MYICAAFIENIKLIKIQKLKIITDQIGQVFENVNRPQKIVSLVPSQTELLVYLGLEKELVGITKFCVYPQSIYNNKNLFIGGTKNPNLEKIRQ